MNDLYQAILRDPEDTTLRLAYADWLDEQDPCAEADRARFIRLSIAFDQWQNGTFSIDSWMAIKEQYGINAPANRKTSIQDHIIECIRKYPEWSILLCPVCEGAYLDQSILASPMACMTCGAMGDLFKQGRGIRGGEPTSSRIVKFHNGMPMGVTCVLSELFQVKAFTGPTPYKLVLSQWAQAVVSLAPITEFNITDRTPTMSPCDGMGAAWYSGPQSQTGYMMRHIIHEKLWDLIDAKPVEGQPRWKEFKTTEDANKALRVAAGKFVRNAVYGRIRMNHT